MTMAFWNWITYLLDHGGSIADTSSPANTEINPATGLPMVGGIGGIDVAGNVCGMNHSNWSGNGHIHNDCGVGGSLENRSRI
jgi:hypothetical protein